MLLGRILELSFVFGIAILLLGIFFISVVLFIPVSLRIELRIANVHFSILLDGIQIGELIAIFGLTVMFIVVLATVAAIVVFKVKNK
jgi:hypothetical protein